MKFDTRCIHGDNTTYDHTGALSVPIYQTATFKHPGVNQSTGFDYSRLQNPTREHLEKTVAALENGLDALAFTSGMAAITALMELFHPGDHILVSDDLYGGSRRLFDHISVKNGLLIEYVDTTDPLALRAALTAATKALFIETPTNPMMQVTDLAAAAALCHQYDIICVVDNTFLTPYLQQPLALGADIVIHSGTKYLGGHNDALAGFLVTARPELSEKLRFIYKTTGACLGPFDSWLLIRGLKTLAVRLERQQASAKQLADFLAEHPAVQKVYYAGLPEHPGYEVMQRQARGAGAMISFTVTSAAVAQRVLEKVQIIGYAESLGGVESLITYPMLQTHADVPEAIREAKGINACLLRLSVGLEDVQDLQADLSQAFEE